MTGMQTNVLSTNRGRWLILLLSPISWMVYFVLAYLLDEAACALNFLYNPVLGRAALIVPILVVLTLLTLVVVLYSGYLGWRLLRDAQRRAEATAEVREHGSEDNGEMEEIAARDEFIAVSGIMLSALFAILTVGFLVVMVVLKPC
jgi:hypothetical protein